MAWDKGKYLADPEEFSDLAGVGVDDKAALRALRRASDRFRGAVNWLVTTSAYTTTLSGNGSTILRLPAMQIDPTLVDVDIDGIPFAGFTVAPRTGQLIRADGWPVGVENIHVAFTAGWEEPPQDVQDVVLDAAGIGLDAASAAVQSVTTGSETVQFNTAFLQSGGTTSLWAEVVDKYRINAAGDRV
jgi:hypothetical protein